ncbi:MAG: hypothetical protein KDE09_13350, partial [Anaerolineales bacterium]|nr:hypothetical protein [Anaerolineales bacterium]
MSVVRSSRSILLSVLYFGLLSAILMLPSTVIAQGNGQGNPPPGLGGGPPADPPGPAPMQFQPPAQASSLEELRPPGADMVGLANAPGQAVAANFAPGRDNLIRLADDQVGVVLEANTVPAAATQLRFLMRDEQLGVNPEYPEARPDRLALMRFELDVREPGNGNVQHEFATQARIAVDLRGLVTEEQLASGNLYLAYEDEEEPGTWIQVDVAIHDPAGLISVAVDHFSTWEAGISAEKWSPSFHEPNVATFSGAATYSYPIEVPAGRAGLTPSVVLSYNSRQIDGRITGTADTDLLADGWSMGDINIVREGVKLTEYCATYSYSLHPD